MIYVKAKCNCYNSKYLANTQIHYATQWNYQHRSDTKSQMSRSRRNGPLSGLEQKPVSQELLQCWTNMAARS